MSPTEYQAMIILLVAIIDIALAIRKLDEREDNDDT